RSAAALDHFKQEFHALADIVDPNLVVLHELIARDGLWYFTMELVRGVDFLSYVRPGPKGGAVDLARLRDALRQLVSGIDALHRASKLHRDLKPQNVLVEGGGRVVILDFGLVADVAADGLHYAADRERAGTPAYMAPEQYAGTPIGPAADLYAVGVMLYEALA